MKVDLAKRRQVMERSQKLGHCICDVRRSCPCDVLVEKDICPCAGERPAPLSGNIKLLDFVHNAGCASKIPPSELEAVLSRLPPVTDPAVISGLAAADDAAIYRLTDNLYQVQTVDVFTPCVNDARLFGQICAANCLSDIYAMGGTPSTALSVLAFPTERLPDEVIFQMMSGAMEKFQEAGVALLGGHSVKDQEIKLGFAITGLIDPEVASSLEKPGVGDVLVLTKPLGTGVLTFAQQIGRSYPEGYAAAETSMITLNRAAADAMREAGATACTDITGFGLFAHLRRMLRPSELGAEIYANALPAFPGVIDALRGGIIPGAIERNREYVGTAIQIGPDVEPALTNLGFDAQTSGGLLIAVPDERLAALRQALSQRGAGAFVIGKIVPAAAPGEILLRPGAELLQTTPDLIPARPTKTPEPEVPPPGAGCCSDISFGAPATPPANSPASVAPAAEPPTPPPGQAASTVAETQQAFMALMRAAQAPGALSEKTKELILFSLVISSRCEPCFEAHLRKAQRLGVTQVELDEAAWCAIALGGAPVKMFYQECLDKYCHAPLGGA